MSILDTFANQLINAQDQKTKFQKDLDLSHISLSKQGAVVAQILSDINLLKEGKAVERYESLKIAEQQLLIEDAKLQSLRQDFINATSKFQVAVALVNDISSKLHLSIADELGLPTETITIPNFSGTADPITGLLPSTTGTIDSLLKGELGLDPTNPPSIYAHLAGPAGSYIKGTHIVENMVVTQNMSVPKIAISDSLSTPEINAGAVSGNTGTFSSLTATSVGGAIKSFNIPHPLVEGMRLIHGCLEGPEYGVYFRGKTRLEYIVLPEYWTKLVDFDTITVQLTPTDPCQTLYLKTIHLDCNNKIYIYIGGSNNSEYHFMINGERKDVPKIQVEVKE